MIQGPDQSRSPPCSPYILVYSRSQENYTERTSNISAQIQSDFAKASYADLYAFIKTLPNPTRKAEWFMVLDERSVTDRHAVVIRKGWEMLNEDGEVDEEDLCEAVLTERTVWKIYRVPFEEAQDFWRVLDALPGNEGDEFLEEERRDSL
jgi:hypothetical protein